MKCGVLRPCRSATAVDVGWGASTFRGHMRAFSARSCAAVPRSNDWPDRPSGVQTSIFSAYKDIADSVWSANRHQGHKELLAFHSSTRRAAKSICKTGMVALSWLLSRSIDVHRFA